MYMHAGTVYYTIFTVYAVCTCISIHPYAAYLFYFQTQQLSVSNKVSPADIPDTELSTMDYHPEKAVDISKFGKYLSFNRSSLAITKSFKLHNLVFTSNPYEKGAEI